VNKHKLRIRKNAFKDSELTIEDVSGRTC